MQLQQNNCMQLNFKMGADSKGTNGLKFLNPIRRQQKSNQIRRQNKRCKISKFQT